MNTTAVPATLRFLPLPTEIAEHARRTMTDAFGHRLHVTKTQAPCRVCLKISTEPQDLILLSYQPLPDTGPYAEVGPIFIHAQQCQTYADEQTFPPDFLMRPLVIRAYNGAGEIVDALVAQPGEGPQAAKELFDDSNVAELHVRHVSYTCFDFKIVRG